MVKSGADKAAAAKNKKKMDDLTSSLSGLAKKANDSAKISPQRAESAARRALEKKITEEYKASASSARGPSSTEKPSAWAPRAASFGVAASAAASAAAQNEQDSLSEEHERWLDDFNGLKLDPDGMEKGAEEEEEEEEEEKEEDDMEEGGGKLTRRKRRRTNKKQMSKSTKGSNRKSLRRRTRTKSKR